MQINYYFILFVISFLILLGYIIDNISFSTGYGVWVLLLVMLTNFGYYVVSVSTTVQEAIIGTAIAHLDGTFLICCVVIEQMRLCKIKVSRLLVALAFIINLFILFTILNTESSGLFYSSVSLTESNHGYVLNIENGKLHILYYLLIAVYFVLSVYFTFYSFRNKRQLSKYLAVKMVTTIPICVLSAGLEMFLELSYSILPLTYIVLEVIYIASLPHINIYDIDKNMVLAKKNREKSSYVFFDTDKKYIGSFLKDANSFPEIENLKIDKTVAADDEKLWKWFGRRMEYFNGSTSDNEVFIEKDSKTYSSRLEYLKDEHYKLNIGYFFEIIDDTEHQKYLSLINDYNKELESKVSTQIDEIYKIQNKLVTGLATIIEERDYNTGGHINRTTEIVRILIETIQRYDCFYIEKEKARFIIQAAHLHDLGKICISDSILNKPGRLNPDEFEVIKGHAPKSGEIVKELLEDVEDEKFILTAYNIARYHHERWDGTGYPDRLIGEQIPIEARIMAVADVYDALVSKRCYKEPIGFDEAAAVIYEEMGTHFDPALEQVFRLSRKTLADFYKSLDQQS